MKVVVGLSAFIVAMLTLGWVNGTDLDMDLAVLSINQKETDNVYGEHMDSERTDLIKPEEVDTTTSLSNNCDTTTGHAPDAVLETLNKVLVSYSESSYGSKPAPRQTIDWKVSTNKYNNQQYDLEPVSLEEPVLFVWPHKKNSNPREWRSTLAKSIASIRLGKLVIRNLIEQRPMEPYALFFALIRLLDTNEILLYELPKAPWSPYHKTNIDVQFSAYSKASQEAGRPSKSFAHTTVAVYAKTFVSIELARLLYDFIRPNRFIVIHSYAYADPEEIRLAGIGFRTTLFGTNLFGTQLEAVSLLISEIITGCPLVAFCFLTYLSVHKEIELVLDIGWLNMITIPPKHTHPYLSQRQHLSPHSFSAGFPADFISHTHTPSIDPRAWSILSSLVLQMPYQHARITYRPHFNFQGRSFPIELIIWLLNAIYGIKPDVELSLVGFHQAQDLSHFRTTSFVAICTLGQLSVYCCGSAFISTFLDAIATANSLCIYLYDIRQNSDVKKMLQHITHPKQLDIIFNSSSIRFILMYPYPKFPDIHDYIQRLSARLIPIPHHQPYNISYTLQEFINLSLWAYHPFPCPELIAKSMPDDESTRHLDPHINRMFCFRTVLVSSSQDCQTAISYLDYMLNYIRNTIPTDSTPTPYHHLTDITFRLINMTYHDLNLLILAIIQFIFKLYPTITNITITGVIVSLECQDQLIRDLLTQRNNHFFSAPNVQLPDLYLTTINTNSQTKNHYIFTQDLTKKAPRGTIIYRGNPALPHITQ
ncbi:hypothetical protein NEHOM01_2321 [Nematocida homosporus]|uniref:uncharacterized protein n=1 Tax=Nematocida homosporus TaxID=1912981 RepID=UPI00221E4630|nr:uncharacterized protein NEHOM01_2321 [Nematocida homosporus]KAI5187721.1 hypothetical protein NEHOM01_2321 [Nematocida homosporus]